VVAVRTSVVVGATVVVVVDVVVEQPWSSWNRST
jgi:hypothetical protein